ncbi:MinD/ParA family protein [Actinoplanes sp. NPDC051343]|uniref:MinD/ParA family protein n=1 Tax=Actinoplanes sp. NPDC051343 TaxID=3363906 RepID=UPI0037A0133F
MDGTETGWGRPAEPAPRWRALLDRARHGSRAASGDEQAEADDQASPADPQSQQYGQPLPTRRPYNPLSERPAYDGRPFDQAPPQQPPPARPAEPAQRPLPQRPVNPLDPRWQARSQPPPAPPSAPQPPPVQPLAPVQAPPSRAASAHAPSAHAPSAQPAANGRRADPNSFFSPSRGRADYPQGRAAAPVAPPPQQFAPQPVAPVAPVRQAPPPPQPLGPQPLAAQPVAPQPLAAQPVSPGSTGARIEWRQSRPADELERAVSILRRKLGTPRVLAFANPKGGVHKTTATVLAAATIGSVRGRGVLAWDDNELRGTLGLRAGSARHARTIRHLLADLIEIESLHGEALLGELDGYLRHASDGSYDVLAGEENPRFAQRLDQATVRRVLDLLRRTHDVICVDTGNNVESVNWQTVMRQADQLVITTVPREDAAFTADWMLDVLDESGMGDLVSNAVTLISCPSPGPLPMLDDFAKHFATRTRAVAIVPYDPSLEVGSSIEYADLQQETRTAWLKAAAVMIEPFAE